MLFEASYLGLKICLCGSRFDDFLNIILYCIKYYICSGSKTIYAFNNYDSSFIHHKLKIKIIILNETILTNNERNRCFNIILIKRYIWYIMNSKFIYLKCNFKSPVLKKIKFHKTKIPTHFYTCYNIFLLLMYFELIIICPNILKHV